MSTQLKSVEVLAKSIISISRSGKKLDASIQDVAVNALGHNIVHGNIEVANKLFKAMPQGSRKASLIAFFETHGHLVYCQADKAFGYYANPKVESFDQVALMATPWHDAKKEVLLSGYDVDVSFARFLKAVENAIKEGVEVKGLAKFQALKEANAKYESELILL